MMLAHATLTVGRAVTAAAVLAALASGCSRTVVEPSQPPVISQILPASAAPGAQVTILGSGFTNRGNAIRIGNGYLLNVSSADGATLRFALPQYLGVCPPWAQVCADLALLLSPGTYQLSVTSAGATSNAVTFQVL